MAENHWDKFKTMRVTPAVLDFLNQLNVLHTISYKYYSMQGYAWKASVDHPLDLTLVRHWPDSLRNQLLECIKACDKALEQYPATDTSTETLRYFIEWNRANYRSLLNMLPPLEMPPMERST